MYKEQTARCLNSSSYRPEFYSSLCFGVWMIHNNHFLSTHHLLLQPHPVLSKTTYTL
ncbi:hypothetical protein Hanom_Chr10g00898511 [Helianthus anomalus]